MTDTISSTPQPSQPEPGSGPMRPQRFRLPEPAPESADSAASQSVRSPRPVPRISTATARGAAAAAEASSTLRTPTAPPEDRYGKQPGGMSMPKKAGLAVIGLLILGGVVGYIGWQRATPTIQGTVTSFAASNTSVVVTFEVDKPQARSATCELVAEDKKGTVVGTASVPVMAGREKNVQSYTLQTTATANTVVVRNCSLTS